jgi:nitroimidazol reductase NimA-like FMN-containing flavoprotein (pyridoxamine 5'-phosphate oxidase superfamily)
MSQPDLDALARRVIDANVYMTLGTLDPDGAPRLSPVFYTPARYTDFYWLSSPVAHHSRNLAQRPQIQIVIFDSTVDIGEGEAVYVTGTAAAVGDDELDSACREGFRDFPGTRPFSPEELRGEAPLRLYVAHATTWEVHVPGRHPVHGRGVDSRQPAEPRQGDSRSASQASDSG